MPIGKGNIHAPRMVAGGSDDEVAGAEAVTEMTMIGVRLLDVHVQQPGQLLGLKRQATAEHPEQHHAEGVNVGAGVNLFNRVTKRLAVECGSTQGWHRWVGSAGDVIGIDHYGASAPGGRLMEEFGFTVKHVVERARALVAERVPC